MKRSDHARAGRFRLFDLLVLIAVLVILVGLVIPAFFPPTGEFCYAVCPNNLRQFANVLLDYESRHGRYPGYANVLIADNGKPYVDRDTGKVSPVSVVVPILPLLDRPDLYRAWRSQLKASGPGDGSPPSTPKVRLELLQCRSDPPTKLQSPSNSYVVNCGMKDVPGSANMPRDWAENGVFFDLFTGDPRVSGQQASVPLVTMSNQYIANHDGLSNTLLMSENVDAGLWTDTDETRIGMLWNADSSVNQSTNPPHIVPPDANMRINQGIGKTEQPGFRGDYATFARPSSYHPGGVNVATCDGRVFFVSEKIDYYVYCLLMSPDGSHVREPGNEDVISGFHTTFDDNWLQP